MSVQVQSRYCFTAPVPDPLKGRADAGVQYSALYCSSNSTAHCTLQCQATEDQSLRSVSQRAARGGPSHGQLLTGHGVGATGQGYQGGATRQASGRPTATPPPPSPHRSRRLPLPYPDITPSPHPTTTPPFPPPSAALPR
jgi:hypothetical protein